MSTIFNIRNLKLPGVSQTALVVGTVVVLAIVGGLIGWNVHKKLTTNTVVAYFPDTLALDTGDRVQIMGVKVGSIDAIEPAGDKMKVTFHYDSKFKVPANATASILNPSLVASRDIQLSPPYTGGPVMASRRRRGGLIIETIDPVVQERSMGNRSRLRPRARRGGGLPTHNLVVSNADGRVRSSVVRDLVLPFDP